MKLIVGLGNPGILYASSRHNIGFCVLDRLAKERAIKLKRDKGTFSFAGKGRIGSCQIMLAKPFTFMNLSGIAVAGLVRHYGIEPQDLLVVCDDLDLGLGRIRIRERGSSAGQRGLTSVIEALGTVEFSRLRVGIGRPPKNIEPSRYVLSPFRRGERAPVAQAVDKAVQCCQAWVTQGTQEAMNIFNQRSQE